MNRNGPKTLESQKLSAQQLRGRYISMLNNPQFFKICDLCDTVISEDSFMCPICEGYRFDTDPKEVGRIMLDRITRLDNVLLNQGPPVKGPQEM